MKRFICIILATVLSIGLSGCVSTDKYNLLKQENEKLSYELNELKNGAEYRITQIRINYKSNLDEDVLTEAEELHNKFPNSEQDNEAQGYVSEIRAKRAQSEAEARAEQERLAAEDKKTQQDRVREIIRVTSISTGKPNSVGGVDLIISWVNKSEKVIKYASFTAVAYNAVGDSVDCTIRRTSQFNGRCTGPYNKEEGDGTDRCWECAWYNNSIVGANLTKINIEYMDGTTEEISGDNIQYILY